MYCTTEEKTEDNSKDERSAQNFKKFRTLCLLTIFSNMACMHTIVFIMFKQNFVVTMNKLHGKLTQDMQVNE